MLLNRASRSAIAEDFSLTEGVVHKGAPSVVRALCQAGAVARLSSSAA